MAPPLAVPAWVVESDEAFVGGFKKKRLSGKVTEKKKVVTLVERGGAARSFHITHVNFATVRNALVTNAHRSSHLRTDDARFYNSIGEGSCVYLWSPLAPEHASEPHCPRGLATTCRGLR